MSAALNINAATQYVVRRIDRSGGGAVLALRGANARTKQRYFWSKKNREEVPPAIFETREAARKVAYRYGGTVCALDE